MRPSRHSVLPAATLPRCHAAPLLCCCAGPMPCYCAFPLPRCRSAVLPRCCAAVLPRYRAAVLSACAGCRTQPIVRVYTFGGRGTVEQEKMQTWERDTGVRSPGHADNTRVESFFKKKNLAPKKVNAIGTTIYAPCDAGGTGVQVAACDAGQDSAASSHSLGAAGYGQGPRRPDVRAQHDSVPHGIDLLQCLRAVGRRLLNNCNCCTEVPARALAAVTSPGYAPRAS